MRNGHIPSKVHHWICVIFLVTLVLALPRAVKASWFDVDCSGNTPGVLTSIQDAVNALAPGEPGYINLLSNCTGNVSISGQHRLLLQQGYWGVWSGQPPVTITGVLACDENGNNCQKVPVISVSGSQDIEIDNVILTGGSDGLNVANGSSVAGYKIKAEGNSGYGISVTDSTLTLWDGSAKGNTGLAGVYASVNSNVSVTGNTTWIANPQPFEISGNGGPGVVVDRATFLTGGGISIHDNSGSTQARVPGAGILGYHGTLEIGNWIGFETVIRNNTVGVALLEGSDMTMYGGVTVENNAGAGVLIDEGGRAVFVELSQPFGAPTIQGNQGAGVEVTNHGQARFLGHNKIRNNGSTTDPLRAGIRVDGTSQVLLEGGNEVTGNIGPGIFADINSSLDVTDSTVGGNTEEGIRLRHMSIAEVQGATNTGGNGGGALTCDNTSWAITNLVAKSMRCANIEGSATGGGKPRTASTLRSAPSAQMEMERARAMAARARLHQ